MPETQAINTNLQKNYLQQNRSVNIQEALKSQEQAKKNSLDGVEIRKAPQQLGKDDFLKLLITQLTYQDPTSPVKDQQFIAQMAQFSSLEQMQNMADSMSRLADRQAHELIGRYVMGRDFVNGENVGGIAQAVFYDEEGKSFLKVSGRTVALQDVQLIGDPSQFQKQYGGLGKSQPSSAKNAKKIEQNSEQTQVPLQNAKQTQVPLQNAKQKFWANASASAKCKAKFWANASALCKMQNKTRHYKSKPLRNFKLMKKFIQNK